MRSDKAANEQPEGAKPTRWASGRVLSEAQRARKREVDRNARRTFKREYQQRVAELEEKVRILSANHAQNASGELQSQASTSNATTLGSTQAYDSVTSAGSAHEHPVLAAPQQLYIDPNVQYNVAPEHGRVPTHPESMHFKSAPSQSVDESFQQREGLQAENSAHPVPLQDWSTAAPGLVPSDSNVISRSGASDRKRINMDATTVTHLFNSMVRYIRSLNPSSICVDDGRNQDFLVRALLVGWEPAMARYDQKCPLWNVLQQVDFWLLKDCNFIERLSLLRLLHRMYMFELTGWTGVPQNIPPWYKPRPVQRRFQHDPVIDHLGWPGLRERLVMEGTGILTNRFWVAFSDNVRLCWNRQPLDAVVFDGLTDQYSLSGEFHYCLSSLAHWRMETPFFTQFPTLFDDFTLDEQIPFPLTVPPDPALFARQTNRLMITSPNDPNIGQIREEETENVPRPTDPLTA